MTEIVSPSPDTPELGAGDLLILVPANENEGKFMPMEDSTKMAFEQGFQQQHQGAMHSFRRLSDGQDNVAEQTRLGHILTSQLVGAKAAGNLNMDPIGKAVLDQRSVAHQPNAT